MASYEQQKKLQAPVRYDEHDDGATTLVKNKKPAAAGPPSTEKKTEIRKSSHNSMRASEKKQQTSLFSSIQARTDEKIVGLKNYAGMNKSTVDRRRRMIMMQQNNSDPAIPSHISRTEHIAALRANRAPDVEELEDIARERVETNPIKLLYLGNMAALKVMGFYLITLETVLACAITVGLTFYWYFAYRDDSTWNGGGLDFILLAFAVTSPIAAALGMAFARRERALVAIANFRSFSHHLFLAHCLWDWNDDNGGRAGAASRHVDPVDWIEHCDAVMAQLIGIGDELSRFLSLPTTSRGRHRFTRQGRKEAARTTEVAYLLLESMTTQRITRLVFYSERLKKIGLPSGEVSRMRQYERFLSDNMEQLRIVKMYRTPQAMRSFARIFTLLLPPFYAPTYAQVAIDVKSLFVGVAFGIITALGLTALFESLQVLEDPFTAFLALDGIDVREEFEVLHFAQLVSTRKLCFPDAPDYPVGRRAALVRNTTPAVRNVPPEVGYIPSTQGHDEHYPSETSAVFVGYIPTQGHHEHHPSEPSVLGTADWDEASLDFERQAVDVELGFPMEEKTEHAAHVRATGFSESDDDTVQSYVRTRHRRIQSDGGSLTRRNKRVDK